MDEQVQAIGYSVPGLVREMLMATFHIPFEEARRFSVKLDEELHKAAWLELYDGTTYRLWWTPDMTVPF